MCVLESTNTWRYYLTFNQETCHAEINDYYFIKLSFDWLKGRRM